MVIDIRTIMRWLCDELGTAKVRAALETIEAENARG